MFRDENIIPLSMLRLSFLDKSRFTGSYKKKRYIFEKGKLDDSDKLVLYIWDDLYCFEKTKKEDIKTFYFDYNKEGIEEGLNYLSSIFDEK